MRSSLSLVVVCALVALASSAPVNPPARTLVAAPGAGGLQSCTPETLNAITDKTQRLNAIRVCINARSQNEKLTLYHYGPKAQWDSWAAPGLDIPMNQLGFNAFRYPIVYKAHAKNAASVAGKERPPIRLDSLKATENECWDYPTDKKGMYNLYNCVAQHRAKFFTGLATKYKTNKSFAKGYATAKGLGTTKLTVVDDALADSMGAGIYYCPSHEFLKLLGSHGETLSECTFTDAAPLKVFNLDEFTDDGKGNLKWLEDIKMFGEAAKNKQLVTYSLKKIKNRFTNQGDMETVFNFHPTGNIAVKYRAASNMVHKGNPPYYVLKRYSLALCKLTAAPAPAQAPANANAPAPQAPANANPPRQRGRSNTVF